ncbi:DNA-directed RNA polymerase III complex subunit Rpc37 [Beauveria bassiana ARSEF 2860]|uniref:DNA-directed RNA polymerase III complex subunit Rpc37 n=1 Tax=Beauveria bassiana (strain ARSEF 2860) TaxID=655819 RepID=J4UNG4_BEAB2|nr:DNA-directed RNA polymerase III complex subunit Rpc37 [Beauveria bassiana ARSEF 2860]EJP66602.1 DNA-directed RNA polymerase III complex subunit Rpc37 [Beauveria bassiana ARSEF 2860]
MSTTYGDDAIDVDIPDAPPAPFPRAETAHMNDDSAGPGAADDDDPITASYPVFLNPALPLGRRLLVLQQPNRTDENGGARAPPSELRLKAVSGMVEVDMPLDYNEAYDRDKGLRWGRTLQTSMAAKNGGSHGLAGGFGFGAVQQRGSGAAAAGRRRNEVDAEDLIDWNEAIRQDKVLRTQTLGGQYPDADEVQYMVGVFQGNDLHLTPVSSLVHLRPQLHHLDAATQQERQAAAKEAGAGGAGGTGSGGAGGTGGPGAGGPGPRAIHMSIKTTADGETVTTETIADRLRSVQGEPWRKMRYTDENEEAAWEVYNESLFLNAKHNNNTTATETTSGKKKAAEDLPPPQESLEGAVSTFASKWGSDQLLEAVSGIKKPEPVVMVPPPAKVAEAKAAEAKAKLDAKEKQTAEAQTAAAAAAEETRRPKRAPRGGGGLGTAKRTTRAK